MFLMYISHKMKVSEYRGSSCILVIRYIQRFVMWSPKEYGFTLQT